VFLTNQSLTPAERRELEEIASQNGDRAIVYHRERLRVILDSPIGFSLRLEHLGIEMTAEEQLSFFSNWQDIFSGLLQEQREYIVEALSKKMDAQLLRQSVSVDELISEVVAATQSTVSMALGERPKNVARRADPSPFSSTGIWNTQTLQLLHQAVTFDWLPLEHSGTYRETQVWVGSPQSTRDTARFVPPSAEEVPQLTSDLISWWQTKFAAVSSGTDHEKLLAITEFHAAVALHPSIP
jgi:hypothetical protein